MAGASRRAVKAKRPRIPEQALHRQIADFLTMALGGTAFFSTIPLGGGGKVRGAILRSLGTKEGIPDLIVVDAGRAIFLEIKSCTGRVSDAQHRCHALLRRARCPVYVVRSLEQAIAALTECGVPMRVVGAQQ